MKRIIFIISCFFLTVFAYGATYEDLLQKAQDYENKKEWIYALGTYADAMALTNDSTEAQQHYNKIIDAIKNGKPGIGEFDMFSLHDEWKKLIQNSELYFAESFPYDIVYDKMKLKEADYSKKTASYTLDLISEESNFYSSVMLTLKEGYTKTDRKNWDSINIPWFVNEGRLQFGLEIKPGYSGLHNARFTKVFHEGSFTSQYSEIKKVTEYPNIHKEIVNYYKTNKVPIAGFASILVPSSSSLQKNEDFTGIQISTMPAFAAKFNLLNNSRIVLTQYMTLSYMLPVFTAGKKTCFDIKLGLYDKAGNLIVEGVKQTFRTGESSYVFTNIPQNKLKELDNQEFSIKILGIWLNYGLYDMTLYNPDDAHDDIVRDMVNPLPNIEIATDKIKLTTLKVVEEAKRIEDAKKAAEEAKKAAEEAKIIKDWQNFIKKMETKYRNCGQKLNTLQKSSDRIFFNLGLIIVQKGDSFYARVPNITGQKSFAEKQKIRSGFKLISINNILIEDLVKQIDTFREPYRKLRILIQEAEELTDVDEIQKEGSQIINQYRSINFIDEVLLYPKHMEWPPGPYMTEYFIAPPPSGTKLLFQGEVEGFFSTKIKEVEIVIP